MKKIISAFFSIAIILLSAGGTMAQEKAKTQITTVKQKGDVVRYSLSSSQPFIYGSNRYVLYIGNKEFTRNEQSHRNGKGYMTFLIPADAYKSLQDGADMYITYGKTDIEDEDMAALAKSSRKCWSLGTFRKDLLTK